MYGLPRSVVVLAFVLCAPVSVMAQQPAPAGHIKTVSGSAFIVRQNATVAAKAGEAIFVTDALRTGADGAVGVTLKDDTRISLGPGSEVRIDRYVYSPGEGGLGMVL